VLARAALAVFMVALALADHSSLAQAEMVRKASSSLSIRHPASRFLVFLEQAPLEQSRLQ